MPVFGFPGEAGQPDVQPGPTPAGDEMHYPQNATFLPRLCKKSRRYKEYCIDKENWCFIKTFVKILPGSWNKHHNPNTDPM